MHEARFNRVSNQRFLPAFRLFAVALCATAFLLPAAQAAAKKEPATKKTVSADSKRKAVSVPTRETASSRQKAGADKSERIVSGGRNVVASVRQRNGRTVV